MFLYPKQYPIVGELVIVKATSSGETGVECELPEYGNRIAFLPLGEITKKRSHIISREMKVGKPKVCEVINIDLIKGYIDLSKRNVRKDDELQKMEEYRRVKVVSSFVVESKLDYEDLIFPLYDAEVDPYEILEEGFNIFESKVKEFVGNRDLSACVPLYNKRFVKKTEKVVVYAKVSSPEFGIDPIKDVLNIGVEKGLTITLVSSPEFMIVSKLELEKVMNILEEMGEHAKRVGVNFEVSKKIYSE